MAARFLSARQRQPERMDQPGLTEAEHHRALAGLERINRWSESGDLMWQMIRPWVARRGLRRVVLLDVACGGGDVAAAVARLARRDGVEVELCLLDHSATALEMARRRAAEQNVTAHGVEVDLLAGAGPLQVPLPVVPDVVMCSLFLHHLDEADIVRVLTWMRGCGAGLVVVNDLVRSRLGYGLAWAGTRLLSRSAIVHYDGPVSVRSALTVEELRQLAERAGLHGAVVQATWMWRMMLRWERSGGG